MSQIAALQIIIEPVVNAEGFELWGLEYVSLKSGVQLRVFIDSDDGVNVDDCAKISRELSVILDVEDPINSEYRLEVSSPGMTRTFYAIEQYENYKGHAVKIKLHTLFEGRRQLSGILATVDLKSREVGVVVGDDDEYLLPYELIEKAQLAPSFK